MALPMVRTTSAMIRFATTWTASRLDIMAHVGAGVTRRRWKTPFSRSRATVNPYPRIEVVARPYAVHRPITKRAPPRRLVPLLESVVMSSMSGNAILMTKERRFLTSTVKSARSNEVRMSCMGGRLWSVDASHGLRSRSIQ